MGRKTFRVLARGAVCFLFKPVIGEVRRAKVLVFIDLYNKARQVQLQAQRLEAANLELQRQLQEVKHLNDELESFSYSVGHDLRAPLRRVNGYGKALSEDYAAALDEDGQLFVQRINATCDHMSDLIEDLLHFSKVTGTAMQRDSVDLSKIARSTADDLRATAPDRQVEFVIEDNISAHCDECLIDIALHNLLGNAW